MNVLLLVIGLVAAAIIAVWLFRTRSRPAVPAPLQPGRPLPDFSAVTEHGDTVRSSDLTGSAAVLLFVRGGWCPFCSSQVEQLTAHYKSIVDLGAKLILVTPKPLATTRRVAEFFKVDFDFWLDESLVVARTLGLLLQDGVPDDYHGEYGKDTVWPAAIIVDSDGIIRFSVLSRKLDERPDPENLLSELRRLTQAT